MEKVKFEICYDDKLNEVVDKIAKKLESFGLEVIELKVADSFVEYEIKPLS